MYDCAILNGSLKERVTMTTTNNNTNNNKEIVKSVMWLIEAAFLGYVGYMLLAHYRHNYIAVAAGLFALFQTAMIVIVHFVKAHK